MGRRWLGGVGAVLLAGVGFLLASFLTIPRQNTTAQHFDTLIVLGMPADERGNILPEARERVLEGVRELRAGRAGHMIVTGGAAHNQCVEGVVMARYAVAQGVPAEDIVVEARALNTIQNIFYSHRIMQERGWTSAEVISSPSHLPRTCLILEHYTGDTGFVWSTHASRWPPEMHSATVVMHYVYEALGTTKLRWFGFRPTPFLPQS